MALANGNTASCDKQTRALYPSVKIVTNQGTPAVACRCCPGGIRRSTRMPRYPSDMTDAEWAVTEPALPAPAWALGKGGRPAGYCRRDLVDGIRYLVKEGIQWRAMPADFPHWRTIYDSASEPGMSTRCTRIEPPAPVMDSRR
jgi:Putative transposase of IS4/5 family (DUF4096)